MDWRDLLAWHQVADAVVTAPVVSNTPFVVLGQDPSRIYAAICSPPAVQTFLGLTSAVAILQGLQIGNADPVLTFGGGLPNLATSVNTTIDGAGHTTGTNTGVFGTLINPVLRSWQVQSQVWEIWADKHGALCQVPIWAAQGNPVGDLYVITVRMERNPCDYVPGTTKPNAKRKAGNCDPKQSLRQLAGAWHGSAAFSRGRNLFRPTVGMERPQDKSPVQPNQYQSGLD